MIPKLNKAAITLNKGKNYFYTLRANSPEKFKYIMALDPNPIIAYSKYIDEMNDLKYKLQDIYYELADFKLMHHFSQYVSKHGFYKHPNNLSTSFTKIVFSSNDGFRGHKTYLMYSKLPKLYEQFMEEVNE